MRWYIIITVTIISEMTVSLFPVPSVCQYLTQESKDSSFTRPGATNREARWMISSDRHNGSLRRCSVRKTSGVRLQVSTSITYLSISF